MNQALIMQLCQGIKDPAIRLALTSMASYLNNLASPPYLGAGSGTLSQTNMPYNAGGSGLTSGHVPAGMQGPDGGVGSTPPASFTRTGGSTGNNTGTPGGTIYISNDRYTDPPPESRNPNDLIIDTGGKTIHIWNEAATVPICSLVQCCKVSDITLAPFIDCTLADPATGVAYGGLLVPIPYDIKPITPAVGDIVFVTTMRANSGAIVNVIIGVGDTLPDPTGADNLALITETNVWVKKAIPSPLPDPTGANWYVLTTNTNVWTKDWPRLHG